MWWAAWCVVVIVAGTGAAAAPGPESLAQLPPLDLIQIDNPSSDDESVGYVLPSLGGRYGGGGGGGGAGAPWLYLLSDVPRESQRVKKAEVMRSRRGFAVNPAVDVLHRNAYNHYIERLANSNRDFLNCVGKRDPWNGVECQLKI